MSPLRIIVTVAMATLGCSDPKDPVRPSYDRCDPGDLCGLATTCARAPITTTGVAAWVCARACTVDVDCTGFAARCVPVAADGGASGWCHRECARDSDCRAATACRDVLVGARRVGVCVPDTGARRCAVDGDCAPLADVCEHPDAGVAAVDASARGTCRRASAPTP